MKAIERLESFCIDGKKGLNFESDLRDLIERQKSLTWQAMESAPRDGTTVLLRMDDNWRTSVISGAWRSMPVQASGWVDSYFMICWPDAWMQMPIGGA